MKKGLLFVVLTFMSFSLFAQNSPISLREGTRSLSGFLSASANSMFPHTTGIMYNVYKEDDFAIRYNVRLGYNMTVEITGDEPANKTTHVGNEFRIGGGIQKSLVKSKCLNGYVAADALIGVVGSKAQLNDNEPTIHSTFEFGIRPAMGIECHFITNFFIGIEWGYDVIFNTCKPDSDDYWGPTVDKARNTILDVADLSSVCLRVGFNF